MKKSFICKCKKTVSGVTLIALIVTVIVALILAGVGIVTLTSKDEVIEKSKLAKEKIEGYTETEGDMVKDTLKYPNSSDCKHKNTEKRNATGTFSGDTYCLDCGVLLATGTIKPCETHPTTTITEAVAATCCSKGNTGNTICTVCGFVVTPGTEIDYNTSNHVGGTEIRNATTTYSGDTYCLGCGALISKGSSKIPEGGTYYVGVTSTDLGDYTGATAIYTEGQGFPSTVKLGDVYVCGEYEYRYKYKYTTSIGDEWKSSDTTGWGVKVLNTKKTSYSELLTEINGVPITDLQCTFMNCSKTTKVPSIPSTVTNLQQTFQGCEILVTPPALPSGITTLYYTFEDCYKMTSIPDLSKCTLVTDMKMTFQMCYSLTDEDLETLVIPPKVTNLYHTFNGCDGFVDLSNFKIPSTVTGLENTFWQCDNLVVPPKIPYGVKNMMSTFESCSSLPVAPEIPNSVVNLSWTFCDCESLEKAPTIPSSVQNISRAFSGCVLIKEAPIIPANVGYLSYTFYGCTSLTGTITINSKSVYTYNSCFAATTLPIVLNGSYSDLAKIAGTATNGNVTY